MRLIKQHLSLWRLVPIIGVTAIAIPIAARVSPTATAVDKQQQASTDQQITAQDEAVHANHSKGSHTVFGPGVARLQDDYYDRRREYWERRVERRLDREDLDDDDDEDAEDSKDKKDSKADKDDDEDHDGGLV